MTNTLTHANQGGRRRIAWAVAVVVGIPILGFACAMSYSVYEERDQVYWSRLYLAKSEIDAIATATEGFHKEYGIYPADLQDLVHTVRDGRSGKQFLTRIATDPWGDAFRYKIEHGATGESVKIWAVPDQKTQDKLGVFELSNKTDWRAILK